jgi:hypothetical protein
MGDQPATPVTVSYELTSGGSAILERLFAGTPHEMVSVYYSNGEKVVMTHYCMLGNQPQMALKKNDGKVILFEMDGTTGIASAQETHMHTLAITLSDPNHIQHEWTLFENGKKANAVIISLTRKV